MTGIMISSVSLVIFDLNPRHRPSKREIRHRGYIRQDVQHCTLARPRLQGHRKEALLAIAAHRWGVQKSVSYAFGSTVDRASHASSLAFCFFLSFACIGLLFWFIGYLTWGNGAKVRYHTCTDLIDYWRFVHVALLLFNYLVSRMQLIG
jgi:hypothetical protein